MTHKKRSTTWLPFGSAFAALLMSVGMAQASVEISTDATQNMSCSAGVCSPTGKKAVLNINDLTNMLAAGDVKVTTGAGAMTITVSAPFSWTSTSRLTLAAIQNVSFRAPVTVAGTGAVTITYNRHDRGGDLRFFEGAKLDFSDLRSGLVVNDQTFTLVGGIADLAAAIKANRYGTYALANDYDAKPDGTYSHAPLGGFNGTFEGLGHTIFNLTVDAQNNAGLFQYVAYSGIARDINLKDANVSAARKAVDVGLLAAGNYGIIAHASASGTVVGIGDRGVSGIGGLVGLNTKIISDSSSSASVSGFGGGAEIGGLAGFNGDGGLILRSYATGNVSGGRKSFVVGGLVGYSYGVNDCYALGTVTGGRGSRIGGLAGSADNSSRSYSIGAVGGPSSGVIGGSMGDSSGGDAHIYWDVDTSGTSQGCGSGDCSAVTGLSDAQLKSGLPAGFDPAIWGQNPSINNGYPYLLANPPPQ